MSKYMSLRMIRRSSVGVRRVVGVLGEGERSEANSSPRAPSVLFSLGKSKNDGSRSDCFKKEFLDLCFLIRRCFFADGVLQVVVFIGIGMWNFFDLAETDGAPTDHRLYKGQNEKKESREDFSLFRFTGILRPDSQA